MNRSAELLLGSLKHTKFAPSRSSAPRPLAFPHFIKWNCPRHIARSMNALLPAQQGKNPGSAANWPPSMNFSRWRR